MTPRRYKSDGEEAKEQLDAFEVWFDGGGDTLSFQALSAKLAEMGRYRSRQTLQKWALRFDWRGRRARRLADLKARFDGAAVTELAAQKIRMTEVVDLALIRIEQALEGGPAACQKCGAPGVCSGCGETIAAAKVALSVRDIERLVAAKLKLIGEPDRVDVTSAGGTLLDLVKMASARDRDA